MCGIAGIVFKFNKPEISRLLSMQKAIEFRGPDSSHIKYYDGVALIHTRLSIIDLDARSDQPMSTEDGRYTVVFNGELYGYLGVKKELEKIGCVFLTMSDTEVILHGYRIWGLEKLLLRLDGMFAFAIWDNLEGRLIIARDRLGEKPIFFRQFGTEFAFSSSIQAIVKSLSRVPDIDEAVMWSFLQKGYVAPGQSIFNGIEELKPGSYAIYDDGELKVDSYWKYEVKNQPLNTIDSHLSIQSFDKIFGNTVKDEVVADVPVGALLSGGVDSSLVCYYASKVTDLTAFTVKMPFGVDESNIAINTAKTLGIQHEVVEASFPDIEEIKSVLQTFSNPLGDSSALGMYIISKAASNKVKVLLTGDGGDEFFAGYETVRMHIEAEKYRRFLNNSFIRSLANQMAKSSFFYTSNKLRKVKTFLELTSRSPLNYHLNYSHIPKYFASRNNEFHKVQGDINALMADDISGILPGDFLSKVDITTMMNSVEARSPFLHRNIIEFSSTLTTEMKRLNGTSKGFLKELLRQKFPIENFNEITRGKRGFVIPVDRLLNMSSHDTSSVILESNLIKLGILDRNEIENFLKISRKMPQLFSRLRYSLFSLSLWYNQF